MRMQKRNCFVHTKCNSVSLTKKRKRNESNVHIIDKHAKRKLKFEFQFFFKR